MSTITIIQARPDSADASQLLSELDADLSIWKKLSRPNLRNAGDAVSSESGSDRVKIRKLLHAIRNEPVATSPGTDLTLKLARHWSCRARNLYN